jgi:hypothetical protein
MGGKNRIHSIGGSSQFHLFKSGNGPNSVFCICSGSDMEIRSNNILLTQALRLKNNDVGLCRRNEQPYLQWMGNSVAQYPLCTCV